MPKQYEAIRDSFVAKGTPLKEAKTRAAKIYNSTHHDAPVTGKKPGEQAMDTKSYAKGGDVRTAHYAAGGAVLGRARDFMKEPDGADQKLNGPEVYKNPDAAEQDYGKSAGASPMSKRTGNKELATVKPRK